MDLLINKAETSSLNVPKLSSSTFEVKNNYYVVTDGTSFNYYTIKVYPSKDSDTLFRFEKSPPVVLEGVAIIDKRVYYVPVADLLRRIIRKSREVKQEANDATTTGSSNTRKQSGNGDGESNTAVDIGISATTAVCNTDEPPVTAEAEMEISQAADFAWNDQIGTLLHLISEKEGEEWEVTSAP